MLWMTRNLADLGTWASVEGSDPYYPVANIQHEQTYKVWKSLGAAATEKLRLSLGAEYAELDDKITRVIIHGHNFDSTWSVKVEAGNDNTFASFVYDSGALDPSDYPDGTIFLSIPADEAMQPYQYIQITITKPAASSIAQVGRVYVGEAYDAGVDGRPDYTGVSRERVDPSPVSYSPGHQRFVERKAQFDMVALDFSYMPEAVIDQLRDIYYSLGKGTPFFLQIDPTGTLNRAYYMGFASNFPEKVVAYGSDYYWDHRLSLEQQL
jgi:hypothetical protein